MVAVGVHIIYTFILVFRSKSSTTKPPQSQSINQSLYLFWNMYMLRWLISAKQTLLFLTGLVNLYRRTKPFVRVQNYFVRVRKHFIRVRNLLYVYKTFCTRKKPKTFCTHTKPFVRVQNYFVCVQNLLYAYETFVRVQNLLYAYTTFWFCTRTKC